MFAELTDSRGSGTKYHVNPSAVAYLTASTDIPGNTVLHMSDGQELHVKGDPPTVSGTLAAVGDPPATHGPSF